MLDPVVLDWLASKVVGDGEERKVSLGMIKREPERSVIIVHKMLFDLATIAAIEFRKIIVVENSRETAEQIIERCKTLFAKEFAAA